MRWQFVGGLDENDRKAFLFTNIVDGRGPEIRHAGGGRRDRRQPRDLQRRHGRAGRRDPGEVGRTPSPTRCRRASSTRRRATTWCSRARRSHGEGHGLDALPIPISTPGFDSAPTLTATNVITRDPDTLVQNMGTYRAALKAPDRLVVRMATRVGGAGGYQHYLEAPEARRQDDAVRDRARAARPMSPSWGRRSCRSTSTRFTSRAGWRGAPINVVRARTVDLLVPAEAELVIEGLIDTEYVEPEAPFGESHGHVALEEFNMPMRVTAITRRKDPIIPSYISQVAPSESSVIKRVAYEPLFLAHLRDTLGISGVKRVALHEPLTGLLRVTIVIARAGHAAHRDLARAPRRRLLQGRLRQDLHRASTTTSIPTTPTRCCGRWRTA